MPDISMCKNELCPSHQKCYRFVAIPNPFRQAYGLFELKDGEKRCEYYTEAVSKSQKARLNTLTNAQSR